MKVCLVGGSGRPAPLEGAVDGFEQDLAVEGLGEELDGPGPQGLLGHRSVGVPGDEDDRNMVAGRLQHLLQVETALSRHPHIEHEAARRLEVAALEKLTGRHERPNRIAGDPDQSLETPSDGRVIVHDKDCVARLHTGPSMRSGKARWNVAPRIEFVVAQIWPPCAWTRERAIAKPMPMPDDLVV